MISDYHKLGQTIKYLWSVDASFAIHNDMRSHTGAVLSLGQGAMMSMSSKQKINTKSSTKAELVGVDDALNFVVWIQLFMGEQMKTVSRESALSKFMHETVLSYKITPVPSNWRRMVSSPVLSERGTLTSDISM
jgi:hypothetical protein